MITTDDVTYQPPWTGSTPLILTSYLSTLCTPKTFGAVGDGIADDTAALDLACRKTAAAGVPLRIGDGIYAVNPYTTAQWNDYDRSGIYTSRGVLIDYDNLHLVGDDSGVIVGKLFGTAPVSNPRAYIFSTEQNLVAGTVRNIRMEGRIFDHDTNFSDGIGKLFFAALIGVNGIDIRHAILGNSSGSRFGSGFTLQNCDNVNFYDASLENGAQFINMGYIRNFVLDLFKASNFSEFVDLDQRCEVGSISRFVAIGSTGQQSQVIDCVGDNINIYDVYAENVETILGVYSKEAMWPTYAEAVANQLNPVDAPALHDISINLVRGKDIGVNTSKPAIFIEQSRTIQNDPIGVAHNISLSNVTLNNTGPIDVREGRNVWLTDIYIKNARGAAGNNGYSALRFGQSEASSDGLMYSYASGGLERVRIEGAQHHGITSLAPAEAIFRDLYVEGYGADPVVSQGDAYGWNDSRMALKPGKRIYENITIIDSLNTGVPAVRLYQQSGGAVYETGRMFCSQGGHKIVADIPFLVVGSTLELSYWSPTEIIDVGRINTLNPDPTGTSVGGYPYLEQVLWTCPQYMGARTQWMSLSLPRAVSVRTSASVAIRLIKRAADGTDTQLMRYLINSAQTAGTILTTPINADELRLEQATLSQGDSLILTATRDTQGGKGKGVDIPALIVNLSLFHFGATA